MSFREFNARYLEPGAMWAMVLGVIFLCQPWVEFLHLYSVTLTLIGIIAFNVAVHVPPPERTGDGDGASGEGRGHG